MAITNAFLNILIFYQRQFQLRAGNTFLALGARQDLPNRRSFLDLRSRVQSHYRNGENARREYNLYGHRALRFYAHSWGHVHDSGFGDEYVGQHNLYENCDFESGDLQ